jgi:hypothetical protein
MEEQKPYEVATRPDTADSSPAALMIKAMAGGMDLDKLEKFMLLQEKYEANQARKAYTQAMSDFKKNPPSIEKDRNVDYTTKAGNRVKYNHASLGNVTEKINAALAEHGLSASWETEQIESKVKVTCKITHVMGHSESTSLSASADDSGGKNAIQALGSSVAYLERYTVLALTGLATHDMDTDAAEPEYITDQQLSQIMDIVDSKGIDKAKFLVYMSVDEFEKIPASDFGKAMAACKIAKGKAV